MNSMMRALLYARPRKECFLRVGWFAWLPHSVVVRCYKSAVVPCQPPHAPISEPLKPDGLKPSEPLSEFPPVESINRTIREAAGRCVCIVCTIRHRNVESITKSIFGEDRTEMHG